MGLCDVRQGNGPLLPKNTFQQKISCLYKDDTAKDHHRYMLATYTSYYRDRRKFFNLVFDSCYGPVKTLSSRNVSSSKECSPYLSTRKRCVYQDFDQSERTEISLRGFNSSCAREMSETGIEKSHSDDKSSEIRIVPVIGYNLRAKIPEGERNDGYFTLGYLFSACLFSFFKSSRTSSCST